MATARPFAYNIGSPIAGTEQVGGLAVGTPTSGFSSTGLQWWNGPDEDLGYVIAQSVPDNTQPVPVGTGATGASVGFFRSSALTDPSFISLSNTIAGPSGGGPFASGSAAKTWLNGNGYWTSYVGSTGGTGASTGNYTLTSSYLPASANGQISFPNHNAAAPYTNPNLLGQPGYAFYINQYDSIGADQSSVLNSLVGRSGTLILTQGVNSVTYSFASNAFSYATGPSGPSYPNQYFWDNQFGGSPTGTISVTSPSGSNFNNSDLITVTVS